MAQQEQKLDEIQWKAPLELAAMNGIHSNSVLFYFAKSPFFDPTSNNAVLFSQAMFNPNLLPVISTREAFEGRLKTMSGLEFVIAEQPAEMAPGTGTGVWVIRKQTRRKRQGEEDEVIVHSTYHVVGENVYMAPAVSDILGGRMLYILSSLNKFMTTAATLPEFSPALGHTYMPPPSKSLKAPESQLNLNHGSKEPTPLPDTVSNSNPNSNSNTKKPPPSTNTNTSTYLDNRLLEETLNIALKYGEEYMDELPITGQPGDFHLSTTGRKEKDKLMVPLVSKAPASLVDKGKPQTPALKTDIPPARKGSKVEKSPRTPGMPKPKRRKSSKAAGAGSGSVSPT